MAAGPALTPGCLIAWFDYEDECQLALVICVVDLPTCYDLTIVKDQRIKALTLLKDASLQSRWRVLSVG
jgi:hypothetical protein